MNLKRYKCPVCGEPVCGHFRKAFAGSLKSKGILCPKCGTGCTNGVISAYVNASVMTLVALCEAFIYITTPSYFKLYFWTLIIGLLICKIFDAFFGKLDVSRRM